MKVEAAAVLDKGNVASDLDARGVAVWPLLLA